MGTGATASGTGRASATSGFVDAFEHSARSLLALCGELDDADWARPTDLPGWSVGDVVAHIAAVECELAGDPVARPLDSYGPHVRDDFSRHMEDGVAARRGHVREQVVAELAEALPRRLPQLRAMTPDDPPVRVPAGERWDTMTLLSNRVVDVWMHEQDVRRAVQRPGNLDGPGAHVVQGVLRLALPYVLAKRAGATPGQSVRLDVEGALPATISAYVGEDGRGRPGSDDEGSEPTASVRLDWESAVVLFGGRRDTREVQATVGGDEDLAARVLGGLRLTP
jgi:uncharacterized protein (TIGR03083 family)